MVRRLLTNDEMTLIENIRAKQSGYRRWEDTYDTFRETFKVSDILDHKDLQLKHRNTKSKTIKKQQTIDGEGGLHKPSETTINTGEAQQIPTRKRASIYTASSSSSQLSHPRTVAKTRETYERQRSDPTKDHQRTLGCWMDAYQSLFERTQHLKKFVDTLEQMRDG
jgi:hypothetical protein